MLVSHHREPDARPCRAASGDGAPAAQRTGLSSQPRGQHQVPAPGHTEKAEHPLGEPGSLGALRHSNCSELTHPGLTPTPGQASVKRTWLRQSYRPNRKAPSCVSMGSSSGGFHRPQGPARKARKNPLWIRPALLRWGRRAGRKLFCFILYYINGLKIFI